MEAYNTEFNDIDERRPSGSLHRVNFIHIVWNSLLFPLHTIQIYHLGKTKVLLSMTDLPKFYDWWSPSFVIDHYLSRKAVSIAQFKNTLYLYQFYDLFSFSLVVSVILFHVCWIVIQQIMLSSYPECEYWNINENQTT